MIWNKKKKAKQISQSLRDKGYKIKYSPDGSTYQIVDDTGAPVMVTASTVGFEEDPAYGGISTQSDNKHRRYRKLIGRNVTQGLEEYKDTSATGTENKTNDKINDKINDKTNDKTGNDGTGAGGGKGDDTALKALQEKLSKLEIENKSLQQQYQDLLSGGNGHDTEGAEDTKTGNIPVLNTKSIQDYELNKGPVHIVGTKINTVSPDIAKQFSDLSYDNIADIAIGFLDDDIMDPATGKKFATVDKFFEDRDAFTIDGTVTPEAIRTLKNSGKKYVSFLLSGHPRVYKVEDLKPNTKLSSLPYLNINPKMFKNRVPTNADEALSVVNGVAFTVDKNGKWKFHGIYGGK